MIIAIKFGKPKFFALTILSTIIALTLPFLTSMPGNAQPFCQKATRALMSSKISPKTEPTSTPTSDSTPSVLSSPTIAKETLDHNRDLSTNNIVAIKGWFPHGNKGHSNQIARNSSGGIAYYPNTANQHWLEYFITRLQRVLKSRTRAF